MASIVDLSLTKPNIFFVFGSLAMIILSMIFERVDNREIGRWPFPVGLAIGMNIQLVCYTIYPIVVSSRRRAAFWLLVGRDEVCPCFFLLGWP